VEFHRILVPITGTEVDEEAIQLACRLAEKKGEIFAVTVITVDRTLPLDMEIESEISKAENVLNHIEDITKKRGYHIETDLLQAREVAAAIVDEAVEREVDLIVMSAKYKTQFGEFSIGDVVPSVLKNAPCHVILYHQHIS